MGNTDPNKGLTAAEAQQRIKRGESNGSFHIKTKSVWQILRTNLFSLFNLINVILAIFVLLTGSYRNALFMGVVVSNALIGVFQELRSKRVIDRLSLISAPKAVVMRDGEECELAVSDIVLDDIILLSSGMQICADGVVVCGECEVDESLITGESDPVVKHMGDELLSGSFVVSGKVSARAVRVGAQSYANKITSGAKYVKKQNSEMLRSINKIISTISVCIVPFALLLFFKAIFITNQDFNRGIVSTVAALIGMIPEGLVLLTSIALAVSSVRLAKKQTLCRDLYCVEHLARVDVLCLDKTGTITEGCMEVNDLHALDKSFDSAAALSLLCGALPDANATLAAIKAEYGADTVTAEKTVPFSSSRKWSGAYFSDGGTIVLGAPEFVLTDEKCAAIRPVIDSYAEQGMRVLVLAQSSTPLGEDGLPDDISAKALVVLTDKIRASAHETLDYFERQGVEIKVISGDDPLTVSNVAGRAGVRNAEHYVDASALSEDELAASVQSCTVFGRVTPERKLLLVKALKAAGHKVAMTGDGANDVLALKEADCSIAMQSGSDAARSVSQLVLMDSDFASMPLVVEEGRRVINNIQRSASLFLVKTIFSFLLAFVFLIAPQPYPFQPIQMTLISALAIGIPSFLLALEVNRNRVSGSFINNVLRNALPGGLTVVLGIVALTVAQCVFGLPQDQTSVIAALLAALACFCVLFGVCRPVGMRRGIMLAALTAAFVASILLFPELFYIVPLSKMAWVVFAVCGVFEIICLAALTALSKRVLAIEREIALPAAVRKVLLIVVFGLSAIFAVWFGMLLTDYFALSFDKLPIVARQCADGSYDGILYSISDGVMTVFGHKVTP